MKHLAPISYKADLIGQQLGVDYDFIEGLNACKKSHETKLIEVLQNWIQMETSPVTLENIVEVIGGPVVKNKRLGISLQQLFRDANKSTIKKQSK